MWKGLLNEPWSWSTQRPLWDSWERGMHTTQLVLVLYQCIMTINWQVRVPLGISVFIPFNEWRKEAQRGRWECWRAHRKLRQYPRQHRAVMVPILVSLPCQSIVRNLFHVSVPCCAQSKHSIHADFIQQIFSSCLETGLQFRELLDLQTNTAFGRWRFALPLGVPGWAWLLETIISPLQQRIFQKDIYNQVLGLLSHLHETPGTLSPNPPLQPLYKMQRWWSFLTALGLLSKMSPWEEYLLESPAPGKSQRSERRVGRNTGFHCHCPQGNALPEREMEWESQRQSERWKNILIFEYFRSLVWGQFQSLGFTVTISKSNRYCLQVFIGARHF